MLNLAKRKDLPRPTRIGGLVGLALTAPFAPFLVYAGFAFCNMSATWATSGLRYSVGPVVGAITYILWLLVVFGAPALFGGLVGAGVYRMRERTSGA